MLFITSLTSISYREIQRIYITQCSRVYVVILTMLLGLQLEKIAQADDMHLNTIVCTHTHSHTHVHTRTYFNIQLKFQVNLTFKILFFALFYYFMYFTCLNAAMMKKHLLQSSNSTPEYITCKPCIHMIGLLCRTAN